MKYFWIVFLMLGLAACKKTDSVADLQIKSVNYYRNDSLIGQTTYSYQSGTGLLEYETTQMYIGDFYCKHHYQFLNDSIQVDEDQYSGSDTVHNLIVFYVSGTQHLISRIRTFSKPFLLLISERNYQYDAAEHLAQWNYYTAQQGYGFVYSGDNATSFNMLLPRIAPPYGTDTVLLNQTYTNRALQPGINFNFLLNPFAINVVNAPSLNIELAGAGFGVNKSLLQTMSYSVLGQTLPADVPLTTYTYSFDNSGRVQSKSYKTESSGAPSSVSYRIDYAY